MKKIVFLTAFLLANLFFTSCDTNDNTFYNDIFVTSPNLVRIEASLAGYHVNDKIYVNCYIDRLLNVEGQTNLLDVQQSTGYANNFNFTYLLERQINTNDWQVVDVNPSAIDVTAGSITGGSFYYASAAFSPSSDGYEFRAGIPLLAAGNYRISFGYNSTSTQIIELRSESINNNLFLNIVSNEGNNLLNSAGYFTFTVL